MHPSPLNYQIFTTATLERTTFPISWHSDSIPYKFHIKQKVHIKAKSEFCFADSTFLLREGIPSAPQEWRETLKDTFPLFSPPSLVLKLNPALPTASKSLTSYPHTPYSLFGTNLNVTLLRNKEACSDPHLCPVTAALLHAIILIGSSIPHPTDQRGGTHLCSVPCCTPSSTSGTQDRPCLQQEANTGHCELKRHSFLYPQ